MRQSQTQPSAEAHPIATDRGAALTLAVIGAGRAGGALAAAARAAGVAVRLAGRDDVAAACSGADAALICVPDAEIESACVAAVEVRPPGYVGHVSGATGLEALRPAAERGAGTFSLHPLQTIPAPDTDLGGAPCAVSGSSAAAVAFAGSLADRLGLRSFELDDEDRVAYHAAASMASNFLVALEESAADLLARAGVEESRELLAPLVLRTAVNWSEQGSGALTGPIARGDEHTVERHLAALRERAPELVSMYESLAERTRELARREAAPR